MDTVVSDFYRHHLVARILEHGALGSADEVALEQTCAIYELVRRPPVKWPKKQWQDALAPLGGLPKWIPVPDEIAGFVLRFARGNIHERRGRPKSDPSQVAPIIAVFHLLRLLQRAKLWKTARRSKADLAARDLAAKNARILCKALGHADLWSEGTIVKIASSPSGRAIKHKMYTELAGLAP